MLVLIFGCDFAQLAKLLSVPLGRRIRTVSVDNDAMVLRCIFAPDHSGIDAFGSLSARLSFSSLQSLLKLRPEFTIDAVEVSHTMQGLNLIAYNAAAPRETAPSGGTGGLRAIHLDRCQVRPGTPERP